jgi:hypothetical protein
MKHHHPACTIAALLLLLAPACKDDAAGLPEDTVGLTGQGLFFPYPNMHLMQPDSSSSTGWRVHIPVEVVPLAEDGDPMPVERFNRLDGFSPATPCLVFFENVEIDPASLPGRTDVAGSVLPESPVQIIDLETGERHPLMAELDAHEQALSSKRRGLVIRPMKVFKWARRYAVVLTKNLRDSSGLPLSRPENFASLVRGRNIPPGLVDWQDHYDALFGRLEEIGILMDDVVLAWDFRTGSAEVAHAQLDVVLEGTRASLPADPDFEPSFSVIESRYLDSDLDPDVDPTIWRHVELTYTMTTFVKEDGTFELDENMMPLPQGEDEFLLIVHVPPSVHDAAPGTVPVLILGHGLLGMPHDYLKREGDSAGAHYAADRYGMIFAAPEWRGLSYRDEADAATAATDFAKFPAVTDDLHMGVAAFLAAARMFRTRFVEAPFLMTADGSGSLVDPDRIYYMGISLGGHQGGVVTALSDVIRYAILQVGGCPWTTMLERSSNWSKYNVIITTWVRDPLERQMLYALSQMFWDPVDPATHIEGLMEKSVLLQEALGDAQVPNMSTELWARSMGIPLVQPSTTHPPFLEEASAPLGPGSSGLFQYDPMSWPDCGAWPVEANLPAEDNCAHGSIRRWEGHHQQFEAFFQEGAEGTIIHPPECGEEPCRPHE